jgi:hypothetical protein
MAAFIAAKMPPTADVLAVCNEKPMPKCAVGQDLALTVAAQQITNAVTAAIVSDSVLGSMKTATVSQTSATATGPLEGLSGLIGAPFKAIGEAVSTAFGGGSMGGIIFGVVLCVVLAIAIYFFTK